MSGSDVESPEASPCCRQAQLQRARFQRLLQARHAEFIRELRVAQQEVKRLQRELQRERAARSQATEYLAELAHSFDGGGAAGERGPPTVPIPKMRARARSGRFARVDGRDIPRAASRTLQQSDIGPDSNGRECAAEQRVCPSTATSITTSVITLPFSKPLVRTRETLIGNLVATSMLQFMAARWVPLPPSDCVALASCAHHLQLLRCRADSTTLVATLSHS